MNWGLLESLAKHECLVLAYLPSNLLFKKSDIEPDWRQTGHSDLKHLYFISITDLELTRPAKVVFKDH